jgi:hypothetical protein
MRRLPLALFVMIVLAALALLIPQLASGSPKTGACPHGFVRSDPIYYDDSADLNGDGVLCSRDTPNSPAITGIFIDNVAQIPG